MSFFLFLLVNATLFIRPAEFTPALAGVPIYEGLMLACLATSFPVIFPQLTLRSLVERPISLCVVGMLVAVALSHLTNFQVSEAWETSFEFTKVILYYFLLVGLVDSTTRLRQFLAALACFAVPVTALAVLQYHGYIHVDALDFAQTEHLGASGEATMLARLGGTGIFQDPNDVCMMLVMMMAISLYLIVERRSWLWVGPLGLFGHALTLTHSRGGFVAMLGGFLILLSVRFRRKAILIGALAVPVVFTVFAGRQTDLNVSGGTGLARIQIWNDGLVLFLRRPLFGVGSDRYEQYIGQVAHNSFIHCFAELGFFGGSLFLGAFFLAFWMLHRLGSNEVLIVDPDLRRLRPYLMALVGGYAGGMLSLSRAYTIPTYTVLGLVVVFLRLAEVVPPLPELRFDSRLALRLATLGAVFVAVAHIYIRVFGHFG